MKHILKFDKFSTNENVGKMIYDWFSKNFIGKKVTEVPELLCDIIKKNMNSDGTLKGYIEVDLGKSEDIKNFHNILNANGGGARISSDYFNNMAADTYGTRSSEYGSGDIKFGINFYDFNKSVKDGKLYLEEKDGKLYLVYKSSPSKQSD